ncbi:MAG TPA: adenosylcobinamide-phosphate synthase CbiB [Bryobacteraceae bacterium]|nr:adenosylcobinamide-phosphate synthase CbiB [Bryobacteraceae bacterium]
MQVVLVGAALDVVLGDPRWLPHPIRGIGRLATLAERTWRSSGLPPKIAGVLFTATVVGTTCAIVRTTLPWASAYWVWVFLAMRSLEREAARTIALLDDLPAARRQLATIVGRDTAALTEPEIVRAVLETVAENFSDAVAAPLFWFAAGGPAAMAAYKAINTLDSMVGYRNSRYREFGWFSARLDDAANWIPSRLSVVVIALAALDVNAACVAVRDGGSQPSPNSGYPEAAFAGALGVQLGGMSTYNGVPSRKATLGEPTRLLTREVWSDTSRLFRISCVLAVAAAVVAVRR